MSKKKKLSGLSEWSLGTQSDLLIETSLGDLTESCLRVYGEEVNLNRSVPDLRDGLKPVGRRILWALSTMPRNQLIKTARLTGEVLGKYHPHGDSSISGAITTSVVSSTPPIDGVGNWGSLIDPAGAARYTNVQMSKFGETFFDKNYVSQMPMIDNYDRKEKEPAYLPALLPNLLLNGAQGIGLGLTTSIPAFTPESLLPLLADLLDGKTFTSKEVAKRLEFYHTHGGIVTKTKDNLLALVKLADTGSASIQWSSPVELDLDKKQLTLTKFGPEVNPVSLIEKKIKPLPEVNTVVSGKGVSYVVNFRKDVNTNTIAKVADKIQKMMSSKISYDMYVTLSKIGADGSKETSFHHLSLMKMISLWIKYRVTLETRSLEWRTSELASRQERLELLLLASNSLDLIFKALKSDDPKPVLVKGLKITDDQAEIILNLRVKQLNKLEQSKIKSDIDTVKLSIVDLKKKLKNPAGQVSLFLRAAAWKNSPRDWATQNQYC